MSRFASILGLLFALLAASPARGEPIGTMGATFEPPPDWKRTTLPGAPKDQFVGTEGVFAALTELRVLAHAEADLHAVLDRSIVGMQSRSPDAKEVGERTFQRLSDGRIALTTQVRAPAGGVEVYYRLLLVGEDTLAYLLFAWGTAHNSAKVDAQMPLLLYRVTWPGEGTEWAAAHAPTTDRFVYDGTPVTLTSRRSLYVPLPPDDESDALLALQTPDHALRVFVLPSGSSDPDQVLTDVLGMLKEELAPVEVDRGERAVDGSPARWVRVDCTEDGLPASGVIVAIPVGDRVLDFRFFAAGRWNPARQAELDALLDAMTIAVRRPALTFPEAPEAEDPWDRPSAAARALTEASELLAPIDDVTGFLGFAADGRVIVRAGDRAVVVTPDGAQAEIPLGGRRYVASATLTRGGTWYLQEQGRVTAVDDQGATTELEVGHYAAAPGGGVFVATDAEQPVVPGFPQLPAHGDATVALRTHDRAVPLGAVPFPLVTHLLPSADGARLAVVGATDRWSGPAHLFEVEVATGAVRDLGALPTPASALGRTASGWLVQGGWEDERWLARAEGGAVTTTTPAPDVVLVAADGDRLVGVDGGRGLVAVPASALAAYAADAFAFQRGRLDAIAQAALAELGLPTFHGAFADEASLTRALAAADRAAVQIAGRPLASDPAAFEEMVGYFERPGPEAWEMLAAQLVRVLRDHGAEWVPSATFTSAGAEEAPSTAFAIGVHPRAALRSALYDSEDAYLSVQEWLDPTDGRRIVVSTDPEALAAAVRAVDRTDLDALLDANDASGLAATLRRWPANRHLRAVVWAGLLARGHYATVRDLAKGPDDVRARLAARAALAPRPAPALVKDVWRALEQSPDDVDLLVLLGALYERQGDEDGRAKARACYERVGELQRWGGSTDAAREGIERLDASEGAAADRP